MEGHSSIMNSTADASQRSLNSSSSDDTIGVVIRVRPINESNLAAASADDSLAGGSRCLATQSATTLTVDGKESRSFTFDMVASEEATQEEIFTSVGKKVIDNCLEGFNGTIFAYGQTGSGKTYTMMGPTDESGNPLPEKRGIIPRSFEYLFALMSREQQKGDCKFVCTCSFLEIYNERIHDLLDANSPSLQVREDVQEGIIVQNLTEHTVENPAEAMEVLRAGGANRRIAETSMNRESSRSHAVFTMTIKSMKNLHGNIKHICKARLNLIDLAGSERQKDTKTAGAHLKEAGSINKSLSALGNVIKALVDVAQGRQRHVAYRDSKLTFLLRDSLGGNTRTFLIANVNPASRCFSETLSTLKFAQRAKMIKNKAVANIDTTGSIAQLQEEIRRLRAQIAAGPDAGSVTGSMLALPASGMNADEQELLELLRNAIASREAAEQEKAALAALVQEKEELAKKLKKELQSNKMILKFRDQALKAAKSKGSAGKLDEDDQIKLLKNENLELQKAKDHNPAITKLAMEKIELEQKLAEMQRCYPNNATENEELLRLRKHTLDLERRLGKMLLEKKKKQQSRSAAARAAPADDGISGGAPCTPVRRLQQQDAVGSPGSPRARRTRQLELQLFKQEKAAEEKLSTLRKQLSQEMEDKTALKKGFEQRTSQLQAELAAAEQSIKELEQALSSLQLTTSTEIATLKRERDEQQREAQARASTSTSSAEMIEGLNRVISRLEHDLNSAQASYEQLSEDGAARESQQRHLRQMVTKYEHQLKSSQDKVTELEQQHAAEVARLKSELEASMTAMEELQKAKIGLQEDLAEINEQMNDEGIEHQAVMRSLEAEMSKLRKQVEALETENTSLAAQIMERQTALDEALKSSDALADEVEALRAENEYAEEQQAALQTTLQKVRGELEAMTEEKMRLGETLANEQERLVKLKQQLEDDDTRAQLVAAAGEQAALQAEMEEMTAKVLALEEDNAKQLARASAAELAAREADQRFAAENQALTEALESRRKLLGQLEEIENDAIIKSAELAECKEELYATNERMVQIGEEKAALQEQIFALQEEMETSEDSHRAAMAEAMEEVEQAHSKMQDARAEQETLAAQLADLEQTLADKDAEVDQMSHAMAGLRADIERLHEAARAKEAEHRAAALETEGDMAERLRKQQEEIGHLRDNETRAMELLSAAEAARQEKNEEIKQLKEQLAGLESAGSKVAALQSALEEKAYRLGEVEIALEQQAVLLDDRNDSLAKMEQDKKALAAEIDELRALNQEQNRAIKRMEADKESSQEDMEELLEQLQAINEKVDASFVEREGMRSALECLKERKSRLEEELLVANEQLTLLRDGMDRVDGHQNNNQKIKMFETMRRENALQRKQIDEYKDKLRDRDATVAQLRAQLGSAGTSGNAGTPAASKGRAARAPLANVGNSPVPSSR